MTCLFSSQAAETLKDPAKLPVYLEGLQKFEADKREENWAKFEKQQEAKGTKRKAASAGLNAGQLAQQFLKLPG